MGKQIGRELEQASQRSEPSSSILASSSHGGGEEREPNLPFGADLEPTTPVFETTTPWMAPK